MSELAKDQRTVFVGQAVKYPGQIAFKTFDGVPLERRIELPVCEDFQVGFSTGLALAGFIPVSFFPRWDFLLLGANQLVNHLDKMPHMGFGPKVIIRTAVGRDKPLDPGPQHKQNHSDAFKRMLNWVKVIELNRKEAVVPAYRAALKETGSFILVERQDQY